MRFRSSAATRQLIAPYTIAARLTDTPREALQRLQERQAPQGVRFGEPGHARERREKRDPAGLRAFFSQTPHELPRDARPETVPHDDDVLGSRAALQEPGPRGIRVELEARLVRAACTIAKAAVVEGEDVRLQARAEAGVLADAERGGAGAGCAVQEQDRRVRLDSVQDGGLCQRGKLRGRGGP